MNKGMLHAAGAYIVWGLLPIYWKALGELPAGEILAHRVAWALVVALVLVGYQRQWAWVRAAAQSPRTVATFIATSALISVNWFVYIWAVNAGYIVEASLGYFINPLVNVLFGMVFLKERLRPGQALAVVVALAGVLYLTVYYGSLPWIACVLAVSFGLYGLLRKTATLSSLEGFTLETVLLAPIAIGYLVYQEWLGSGSFAHTNLPTMLLLIGAGVVTAVPLLLFASGARLLTMTLLGILQYIAPTLQFLLGVIVYGESLSAYRLLGFAVIWLALGIYTIEGFRYNSLRPREVMLG